VITILGKKTHTVKTLIITNLDRKILFVSPCWCGSTHDYAILKQTFAKQTPWFEKFSVRVDSGFQGFEKDYAPQALYLPQKSSKKNPLTQPQKDQNTIMAKERIRVEHAIGGMKRFRVLSDRLRMHNFKRYHSIQLACAALWNFCIT
jgi:hypothetical protein